MNRMTKSNEALLEQLIEQVKKEYDACGIAVAVIDKKGNTQYQKFFGYRDEEQKLPIDENTIFGLVPSPNPLPVWPSCRWRKRES